MALILQATSEPALAQTQAAPIPGLSRQPTPAAREALLDRNDAVVLLLDHQTGLFQTVKDVLIRELRANTVALARIAGQALLDRPGNKDIQLDMLYDYRTNVPLDTGHFALEDKLDEMAPLIRGFLDRKVAQR